MKRLAVVVLAIALGVVLLCLGATQKLVNQSGEAASGVVITFPEAVEITSYDKSVFPTQSPATGESETFTFSGGTLAAGGTFQVSWSPSAKLRSSKWIASGSTAPGTSAVASIPTTYEEIMAKIAHYPGPDEPLYVPAEGEAIWLTDLGGRADIYDNDSIKINYAPWFDKSQITKVEVYRNGIKMRFLPDKLDVLTNEQMKTFDGNPAENTPKSSHTDHAIFGYQYRVGLYTAASSSPYRSRLVTIKSPTTFSGSAAVSIGEPGNWMSWMKDADITERLRGLKTMGFETAQFYVTYYMLTPDANEVVAVWNKGTPITEPWNRTLRAEEVRRLLRLISSVGLKAEIGLNIWLSREYTAKHAIGFDRGAIRPSDPIEWFKNYEGICLGIAQVAQEEGCDVFCIAVELASMEQYASQWESLAASLRRVFSGRLTFAEPTHWFLVANACEAAPPDSQLGSFWGALDSISVNMWPFWSCLQLDEQTDQRFSTILRKFVRTWWPVIQSYRQRYPEKPIGFSEIGTKMADGIAASGDKAATAPGARVDLQEQADVWAAMVIGAAVLGLDRMAVWSVVVDYAVVPSYFGAADSPSSFCLNMSPALLTVASLLGLSAPW
jgi:hypothetical protein